MSPCIWYPLSRWLQSFEKMDLKFKKWMHKLWSDKIHHQNEMTNERRLKRTNMPNVNNDYKRFIQFQISGLLIYQYICVRTNSSRHSLSSSVFCLQKIHLKTNAIRIDVPFWVRINYTWFDSSMFLIFLSLWRRWRRRRWRWHRKNFILR